MPRTVYVLDVPSSHRILRAPGPLRPAAWTPPSAIEPRIDRGAAIHCGIGATKALGAPAPFAIESPGSLRYGDRRPAMPETRLRKRRGICYPLRQAAGIGEDESVG